MAKWIKFDFSCLSESGKTKIWTVRSKENGALLGRIKWYAQFRKYSFFPLTGTVFENDCLCDLGSFCKEETQKHKSKIVNSK